MDVLVKDKQVKSDKSDKKEHHIGHRQRLKSRFLETMGKGMQNYELLELLLFYTNPRKDMKPLAKELLDYFDDDLDALFSAEISELERFNGVGETAIVLIKAIQNIVVRNRKQGITDKPLMDSWDKVIDYCQSLMGHQKVEEFRILYLDQKNKLIIDEVLQRGTIDQATIYPREVMKRALDVGASAFILVHNHPSGDPTPSQEDIELTKHIQKAAEMLSISLHDHLIICQDNFSSLRSLGLM